METQAKVEEAEFTATEPATYSPPAVIAPPSMAPLGHAMAGVPLLAGALVKAQTQCRAVEKDARNTFHKYAYASAEAIIEEAKGPLNACGLALMPVGLHVNGHEKDGENRYELEREFLLLHESGQSLAIKCHWPICPDKGRPLDKATASADTTSLAYTLRDLLLMPRVDPADDMNTRNDPDKPAAKPAPAKATNGAAKKPEQAADKPSVPEPKIGPDDLAMLIRLIKDHHKGNAKELLTRFKVKKLEDLLASQHTPAVKFLTGSLAITDEQQTKIRALIEELKVHGKVVKERLYDLYRAESLSQLSRLQADDMLNKLATSRAVKAAPAVPAPVET